MNQKHESDQIALRIGLNQEAANACYSMIESLKADNSHIKVAPSRFLGFVVKHYFERYFEKDRTTLAHEFFDSKEYLATELAKAKTGEDVKGVLLKAIAGLEKSSSIFRKKSGSPSTSAGKRQNLKPAVSTSNMETVTQEITTHESE